MATSPEWELPDIRVKAIRPHIDHVFTKLTADEWRQLKLGAPNNATKFLLAELIMNMTSTVSSQLSATPGYDSMAVTVEKDWSSLGDALGQSLAPGSSTNSESLDQFTELVVEEVTKRVNASRHACSTSTNSTGPPQFHQTTVNQLEEMVSCLCKVLKESACDIEGSFKSRLRRHKTLDVLNKLPQGKTTPSYSCYSDE